MSPIRSRRFRSVLLPAVVAASLLGATTADASAGRGQPGDEDNSFGTNGRVVEHVGSASSAEAVARLSSGKLMVAGWTGSKMLLMRFTANGHLDQSFSGDGKVTTSLPGKSVAGDAMAIVPGGKILVGGASNVTGQPDSEDLVVARYKPNGQPDASFGGGDGRVVTDLFGGDDQFEAMAVGSDGRAVVAAMAEQNGTLKATVARFTADGTLDHSFSGDGKLVLPQAGDPFIEAVAVLPSLKVVAGGQGTPNGGIDFVLYGITKTGTIDQGFGTFGVADTDFAGDSDVTDVLAVDSHGRIVAGGAANDGGDTEFALARYTKTGDPDMTFSQDGKATFNFGPDLDRVFAIAFQGQKIVAGGRSDSGDDERWAIVRVGSGGALDGGFGTGGKTTDNLSSDVNLEEEVASLVYDPGASQIVGSGFTGDDLALAGFVA